MTNTNKSKCFCKFISTIIHVLFIVSSICFLSIYLYVQYIHPEILLDYVIVTPTLQMKLNKIVNSNPIRSNTNKWGCVSKSFSLPYIIGEPCEIPYIMCNLKNTSHKVMLNYTSHEPIENIDELIYQATTLHQWCKPRARYLKKNCTFYLEYRPLVERLIDGHLYLYNHRFNFTLLTNKTHYQNDPRESRESREPSEPNLIIEKDQTLTTQLVESFFSEHKRSLVKTYSNVDTTSNEKENTNQNKNIHDFVPDYHLIEKICDNKLNTY